MWLFCSLRSPAGEIAVYNFYSEDLEPHMEILNHFVTAGDQLLHCFLVDQAGRRTSLPVTAFDGSPIAYQMRKLESEYQFVLRD